jgi:hypothetical protein
VSENDGADATSLDSAIVHSAVAAGEYVVTRLQRRGHSGHVGIDCRGRSRPGFKVLVDRRVDAGAGRPEITILGDRLSVHGFESLHLHLQPKARGGELGGERADFRLSSSADNGE